MPKIAPKDLIRAMARLAADATTAAAANFAPYGHGHGEGGAPTNAKYLTTEANSGLSAEVVVGLTPSGQLGGTWDDITVDAAHGGSSHATAQAAAEATAAAALSSHASDATAIHGIADTAALETTSGAQAKVDAHTGDTTDAHDASAISILDTANDFTATDVEGALAELQADNEAHVAAPGAHHVAFVQGDHDALPNPHHSNANDHARQHGITSATDHTFPGGTSNFLRADGTFAAPPGGSSAAVHHLDFSTEEVALAG